MDFTHYSNALTIHDRARFEQALQQDNTTQAAKILLKAGLQDQALQLCIEKKAYHHAIDIAIQIRAFDTAERLCDQVRDPVKLAQIYVHKGEIQRAAQLLESVQEWEKAAKLYTFINDHENAGRLYEKTDHFMDAAMSYQKAQNTAKQIDMQIKAFESDYELANGDLAAINVSRVMATYAAKMCLEDPKLRLRGLATLEKAEMLEPTAQEYLSQNNYVLAAYCFEALGKQEEAILAYAKGNEASVALALCRSYNRTDLEVEVLKSSHRYFQLAQKFMACQNFGEAILAIHRIAEGDPSHGKGLELEGDIYCRQKKFKEAAVCYERVLKAVSKSPEDICRVAFKAGYSYESLEEYPQALSAYQRVYDIDSSFHDIANILSNVAQKLRAQSRREAPGSNTLTAANPLEGTQDHPVLGAQGVVLRTNTNRTESNQPNSGRKRTRTIRAGDTDVPMSDFSRYQIETEVAHGGMGIVYRATDTLLMRTVALKILAQKLKDNPVALEFFMREARASARLQHINIVTVYDIGALDDGNIYMAMEYIEGKNLKQLIQHTGIFPTKFLVQVATHVCRGLQYAHDNGIVHRDIKASNIMIAKRNKTLKILDLGLAKIIDDNEKNSTQVIGTPYYISPEQILGNKITPCSDIYSLGVTLFELATGSLPYTTGDLLYKHVHEPVPLPSSINPKIHPVLESIIVKMMQKAPEDRYASCNEVIKALKRVDVPLDED